MRNARSMFLTFLLLIATSGAAQALPGLQDQKMTGAPVGQKYGKEFTDAKLVPINDVFERPESYAGKTIKLEGTILEVCQKQGCWLTLGTGDNHMMVDLADHTFFVPKDSSGRHVVIEGTLMVEPMSKEELEHRASEGAKSMKIASSRKLSFEANGVVISAK